MSAGEGSISMDPLWAGFKSTVVRVPSSAGREARMICASAVPDSWRIQMPAVRILADHMLTKDRARSALTTKKKVCRVSIEIAVCKEMISKKSVLQS